MRLLRSILCFWVLLAQVCTVRGLELSAPTAEPCTMSCCAWLVEQGMDTCVCEPNSSRSQLPPSLPPQSERVPQPQVTWATEQAAAPGMLALDTALKVEVKAAAADAVVWLRPPLRRPVLFCSFLN